MMQQQQQQEEHPLKLSQIYANYKSSQRAKNEDEIADFKMHRERKRERLRYTGRDTDKETDRPSDK